MNLPELNRKLLAAARRAPVEERVPYAFEKRVMARLGRAPKADPWAALVGPLWCGAVGCSLLALTLQIWSFQPAGTEEQHAFSRGVEDSLLTSVEDFEGLW